MFVDSQGKIKGFISPNSILNYIKQMWDENATSEVEMKVICPTSECNWKYEVKEHSEDSQNWYMLTGYIAFKCNDTDQLLFYCYDNLKSFTNLEHYSKYGLAEMIEMETTHIALEYSEVSAKIIKQIVSNFGGGWFSKACRNNIDYIYVDASI